MVTNGFVEFIVVGVSRYWLNRCPHSNSMIVEFLLLNTDSYSMPNVGIVRGQGSACVMQCYFSGIIIEYMRD